MSLPLLAMGEIRYDPEIRKLLIGENGKNIPVGLSDEIMTYRGAYSVDTVYDPLDTVTSRGNSYLYIAETPTKGQPLPEDGAAMNDYWGIIARAGVDGAPGETPIITIGSVTTGDDFAVTISGTPENPVLNFVLPWRADDAINPEAFDAIAAAVLTRTTATNPAAINAAPDRKLGVVVDCVATQEGTGDPSWDNKRPIVGTERVNAWAGGRNLANASSIVNTYPNTSAAPITDGVRVTLSGVNKYAYAVIPIDAPPTGTQLTLSANWTSAVAGGQRITLGWVGRDYTHVTALGRLTTSGGKVTVTVTERPEGSPGLYLYLYHADNVTVDVGTYTDFTKIQVEIGDTATAYKPYTAPTIHTHHATRPLYGLPGYPDSVDFGAGPVTRRTKKVTFDGSADENWQAYNPGDWTSTYCRFYLALAAPGAMASSVDRCTQFVRGNASAAGYHPNTFEVRANGTLYVSVEIPGVIDAATLRTHLASDPMDVLYALATPEITQGTPHDIWPVEGGTTVWTDGDSMTVTYAGDTDTPNEFQYLRKEDIRLEQRIDALEAAILALGGMGNG